VLQGAVERAVRLPGRAEEPSPSLELVEERLGRWWQQRRACRIVIREVPREVHPQREPSLAGQRLAVALQVADQALALVDLRFEQKAHTA
jgi:hypothetical protein